MKAPKSLFMPSSRGLGPPYSHIVQLGDPVLRRTCESVPKDQVDSLKVQDTIRALEAALVRYVLLE